MWSIKKVLSWLITVFSAYFLLPPALLLIIGINAVIRFILKVYLFCSRSGYEIISDGVENLFPTHPGVMGAITIFVLTSPNTVIDLQNEGTHWMKNVLEKPGPNNRGRMYARLETLLETKWGYGCRRRDTKFNIDNHVKLWTDTSPDNGEYFIESEFFQEIIPKLSQNWDFTTKPGWEWVIIPKVQLQNDKNPQSVRVFRIHHSYTDAAAVFLLIAECLLGFSGASDGGEEPLPLIINPKAKISSRLRNEILYLKLKGLLLFPYYLMKGLLYPGIPEQDLPLLSTSPPGQGTKHFGVSKPMDIRTVHEIRTKLGEQSTEKCKKTSVANALASVMVSALTQVLDEEGRLSDKSTLGMYIPTAIIPYKDSRLRNQGFSHPLIHPLRANKRGQMEHINVLQSIKYSFPILHFLLALGHFPQRLLGRMVPSGSAKFPATVGFISVPTSRVRGHLKGCGEESLVSDIGGWAVPSSPTGLCIGAVCYADKVRFWCAADDSVMNERQFARFLDLLTMQA